MNRLDGYLTRLGLETVLPETTTTILSLHVLDPGGDTFRYATSWDKQSKQFVPAKRPEDSLIDVVAMGDVLRDAANIIGGGVLSMIDDYTGRLRR
jgi:hypothetical protein